MSIDSINSRATSVVILGSGNVASHIARRLEGKVDLKQIYSRNFANASALAQSIDGDVEATDSIDNIYIAADIYIVAVKDDAIAEVAGKLSHIEHGVVVHTSGSAPDDACAGANVSFGVLYPLQTFSKDKAVDWTTITVFTYASDENAQRIVDRVGYMLSNKVQHIDERMRSQLHIAAVFACNFVNYMWIKSAEILARCGCTLSDLAPLLAETMQKALTTSPESAQTGPARRGDHGIIARHLAILDNNDYKIYKLLSDAIMEHYGVDKTDHE